MLGQFARKISLPKSIIFGALWLSIYTGPATELTYAEGWKQLDESTLFFESQVPGESSPIKLWFYLPRIRKGKIPCVFIAPAGSKMFHGMNLTAEDRKEHLPYVKRGFAVVAYELEGALAENAGPGETIKATKAFKASQGGVLDGKRAINAALSSLKEIDQNRLFAAGHSSAGTTALALAASEARIRACAAFAPCCNLKEFFGGAIANLNLMAPGFSSFISSFAPDSNTNKLKCPVLIFNAADDDVVSPAEIKSYVAKLQVSNKSVKTVTVASGGHFNSMIDQGIPAAIQFFQTLK
ncbi:MAG: acetylxylan esterase [Candidatus Obscuribacterales bacterium]|nr:acetylxylan esterase [Candidatus Obscuribacterales bacterium]